MSLPSTIQELIHQWSTLLDTLTDENNEQVAYDIVGTLAGNDLLWDKYYEVGKEPNIRRVFDSAASLELPDGIYFQKHD